MCALFKPPQWEAPPSQPAHLEVSTGRAPFVAKNCACGPGSAAGPAAGPPALNCLLPKQVSDTKLTETYDLSGAPHHVFGREAASGAEFVLDDPSVSRSHAAIVHHADGRIFLIDLQSVSWGVAVCTWQTAGAAVAEHTCCTVALTLAHPHCPTVQREGTTLDGAPVPPNKPTVLRNGSVITFGACPKRFTLRLGGGGGEPASASAGPTTVRASHLLVKHRDSRRPSSWKEPLVTRRQGADWDVTKGDSWAGTWWLVEGGKEGPSCTGRGLH